MGELPSKEDEFEYFRVQCGEKHIKVKASSSFEAAVKMAFALRELGQLNINGVYIVVISPNGDEFKYNAIKADTFAVELVLLLLPQTRLRDLIFQTAH